VGPGVRAARCLPAGRPRRRAPGAKSLILRRSDCALPGNVSAAGRRLIANGTLSAFVPAVIAAAARLHYEFRS